MKKTISILILTFMICGLLISCGEAAGSANQENPPVNSGESQNPGGENQTPGGENQTPGGENQTPGGEGQQPDDDEVVLGGDEDTSGKDGVLDDSTDGKDDSTEGKDDSTEGGSENDNTAEENGSENKPSDEENTEKEPPVGYQVGNLAPTMDIERLGGGSVNSEDYRGKVVVINFWGTWCPYCLIELPDFSRVAAEYENVVVIAVHSNTRRDTAADYVSTNFPESDIIFAYDTATEGYYSSLGGTSGYPRTLVLDAKGVITYARAGMIDYAILASLVESAGARK